MLQHCEDDSERAYTREVAVEPLRTEGDHNDDDALRDYGVAVIARLLELDATRRIVQMKGQLQRTNPAEEPEKYNKMFGDLLALEEYRRGMREHAVGSDLATETG